MRRRQFLCATAGWAVLPLSARAQQSGKVWRLGFLTPSFRDSAQSSRITAVLELAKYGFVEGKNLVVESRYAEGAAEQLPELASDLAKSEPDAIIAVSNPAIRAAKEAAANTPIVMAFAGEDPIAAGLVTSLSRPGGTVTGMALLAAEGDAKRVELMAQVTAGANRIALLATDYAEQDRISLVRKTANALGFDLAVVRARNSADYDRAFAEIAAAKAAGLVIGSSPVFFRDATDLALRAAALRLPTVSEWREMVQSGCLMAYGPNVQEMYRKVGGYVARIFQGARPADLPVEQPTTFQLTINFRVARALAFSISPAFAARADEVIE